MPIRLRTYDIVPLESLANDTHIFFVIPKNDERRFSNGEFVQESEKDKLVRFVLKANAWRPNELEIYDLMKEEDQIELLEIYEIPRSIFEALGVEERDSRIRENNIFTSALRINAGENPSDIQRKKERIKKEAFSEIIRLARECNGSAIKLSRAISAIRSIKEGKKLIIKD